MERRPRGRRPRRAAALEMQKRRRKRSVLTAALPLTSPRGGDRRSCNLKMNN